MFSTAKVNTLLIPGKVVLLEQRVESLEARIKELETLPRGISFIGDEASWHDSFHFVSFYEAIQAIVVYLGLHFKEIPSIPKQVVLRKAPK